jgi:hypothetical protein
MHMGTNYYVDRPRPCCPTCGQTTSEVVHIGKSSAGWRFQFRGYREEGLTSAKAWLEFLQDKPIVDEYGRHHELTDFVDMIRSKQDGRLAYGDRVEIDAVGYPVAHYEFS